MNLSKVFQLSLLVNAAAAADERTGRSTPGLKGSVSANGEDGETGETEKNCFFGARKCKNGKCTPRFKRCCSLGEIECEDGECVSPFKGCPITCAEGEVKCPGDKNRFSLFGSPDECVPEDPGCCVLDGSCPCADGEVKCPIKGLFGLDTGVKECFPEDPGCCVADRSCCPNGEVQCYGFEGVYFDYPGVCVPEDPGCCDTATFGNGTEEACDDGTCAKIDEGGCPCLDGDIACCDIGEDGTEELCVKNMWTITCEKKADGGCSGADETPVEPDSPKPSPTMGMYPTMPDTPKPSPTMGMYPTKPDSPKPSPTMGMYPTKQETEKPFGMYPTKQETEKPFGMYPTKQETDPPFGMYPTKQETEKPFGMYPTKQETEKPFGMYPTKQETEPPFGAYPTKQETEKPFGMYPTKQETLVPASTSSTFSVPENYVNMAVLIQAIATSKGKSKETLARKLKELSDEEGSQFSSSKLEDAMEQLVWAKKVHRAESSSESATSVM